MLEKERTDDTYTVYYHLRAPHGLINDPNGLIYYRNQYHVFFQWNPEGTTHENKTWGHAVSDDLINWDFLEPALEPTDWFDKNGCYSGSAFEKDGKLYLFYTGNVRNADGDRESYQCLAVSEDGVRFEKKGPLFEHPKMYTAHLRDPKIWKEGETYWMVLGAQREDLKGTALVYRSTDILNWTFEGEIMDALPDFGYMWECPDVLKLENKDIFVFSPQGLEPEGVLYQNIFQTGYMLGHFQEGVFLPDNDEFIEMDRGFEFYAPQSFTDNQNRTIVFGWMGTMPPEEEAAVPTIKDGWIHHLSLPREIKLISNKLVQQPVEEVKMLRLKSSEILEYISQIDKIRFNTPEQEIECVWTEEPASFAWTLRDEVAVSYEAAENKLTVERTNWLTSKRETRSVYLDEPLTSLRLFLEDSAMELYVNAGREVFSLRYFNEQRTDFWEWQNDDWKEYVSQLTVHELKKAILFA
ncbi:beta-fructofuranosidase [Alkalibacterium subtropicum]|uniref:Sucrose-6-phosphate hydrolase n=1 Tax=Alkalibacterium subtropicum TaxID=753702 RepID=A0A1I1K1M8_9LACT|nr:glycoside hydrolase family 32 protein [Alkalibacterium subtropicum]SFC54525.1 beta-fructofuranosidase [Alkalibacterium subtropicum]